MKSKNSFGRNPQKTLLLTVILLLIIFTSLIGATGSVAISLPLSLLFVGVPIYATNSKEKLRKNKLEKLWPEILDLLISGIQSGLSLSQSIASMGTRGPLETRPIFTRFKLNLKSGQNFETSLHILKFEFSNSLADQVIEVMRISQSSGNRDTALTLRTIAEFITADLSLRQEIKAKHSWIRNAALLAAATPWILLLILSSQESARRAYASTAGVIVLFSGALFSAIAFLWMQKVGKIEYSPRVFA